MTQRVLQILAADYCCVYRFIKDRILDRDVEAVAEELGVTTRTIWNYRRRFQDDQVYVCHRCWIELKDQRGEN